MNTPLLTNDWMELSAYLDEQLVPTQRARLEQRLQAEPALREELEEMRRLRVMLRSLKPRKVPHNFTLTRQMAVERKRSPLVPWLSWSSGLASLLLIASLFLRMNLSPAAQAPLAMLEPSAAAEKSTPAVAESNRLMPMIINWTAALGMGGGGDVTSNLAPMVGAEGKGGGSPDSSVTQPPFIGFPLPGSDVTGAGSTQPTPEFSVVEAPTESTNQADTALATQAPAVQALAPTAEEPAPGTRSMESSDNAGILGLPAVEDEGTMRVVEKSRDTQTVLPGQPSAFAAWLSAWWLSVLLLALALGSGAAALLLRRKHV